MAFITHKDELLFYLFADCEKWENIDKFSVEYKKWHESKGYVEWKERHESGKADCSRVTKLSRREWEHICGS